MKAVLELEGLSRADWLAARRNGIGSSDVAAILGMDRFRGPFDVYASKISDEDNDGSSLLMRLGQHMEDGIARAYADETGSTVTKPTHMYAHDHYPWMLANVDRFTDNAGPLGVLELKMSSAYSDWDDGCPEAYQLQVMHQLAVTGLEYADLCALIGGRELRMFRFDRDETTIGNLIDIEAAFWDQVQRRDPPPVDERSTESLKRLYRQGTDDAVELEPAMAETINALRHAKVELKESEALVERLSNELRAALGPNETGTLGGVPVVTWATSLRQGFARERFEADHPDLALLYTKSSPVRTLRMKREAR